MPELIPLISSRDIAKAIETTGRRISEDYQTKDLVLVGVLKGAFIFLADLSRMISIHHEIDLIGASSYRGTDSTGNLVLDRQPNLTLTHRDVLLVEDIVDTGQSLEHIVRHIRSLNPASIKICALIDKQERRKVKIDVAYSCFTLEKGFIVGYGLDYNEKYRNLPAIYDLKL